MGFSADLDMTIGEGSSLSVNSGKTDLNADYKGISEQSGIFTGDGGLDLTAGGKTTLIGGAITTTEAARDAGRNKYDSLGGITTQDIKNTTSYDGDAIQVGVSIGQTNNKPQASMNGLGYGTDSDSDSSVTRAGITGIAGNKDITTENRAEYAGILENSFDAGQVNEELGAQTQITQEFGKEAPKAVAEFSQNRMDAIRANPNLSADEKMAAISKWDEGGIYRVAAHTVLGALGTGSVEGALTTGGVAAAAPTLDDVQAKLAKALIDNGMSEDIANGTASGVVSLTLLGAGTAAGLDTSSTVTAVNIDANNRQLHPNEAWVIKLLAKEYAKKKNISVEEAEKYLTRGALYNIDSDWQQSYDYYASDDIQEYQEAYEYLLNSVDYYSNGQNQKFKDFDSGRSNENDAYIIPSDTANNIIDRDTTTFTASEEEFNNHRIYLKESFDNVNSLKLLLDNAALQNPATYGRAPETAVEVQNAKAEGSSQGFINIISAPVEFAKEGISKFQDPYGTVIDGFKSIGNAVKAIPDIPNKLQQARDDFSYIGYEDNLAIMQGKGLEVARNDAESSTELGIGIGLSGLGVGSIKKLGKADVPSSAKAIPAKQDTINTLLTQTRTNAEGKTTAYSKGAVGDNIIEGSDFDNFTNTAQQVAYPQGSRKTWPNFPGVSNVDGKLVINDSELYLQGIDKIYDGAGTPLNERTRQHIANSISRNNVYAGPNGLPGTHAEVRTYNDITTRYPEVLDTDISIATVQGEIKRKDSTIGKDFPACSNCSSILPNEVYIPTGRAENPNNGLYFRED